MIVSSILKNALWAFNYPRFDKSLVGEYQVGATKTRLPGCTACQIHYPAKPSSNNNEFHPYFRPEAVTGLAHFSRMDEELLSYLKDKPHPCLINAEPAPGEFPIVIFSHGLGGCMEMYTQVCQQVASRGYYVIALEHEDGSGTYAENENGDPIYFKRPDDTPYSRAKALSFRTPMLQKRVKEIDTVITYIQKNGLSGADTTKPISLLGHSFGAATMAMVAQETSTKLNSVCLLDTWAFPLKDDVLRKGIPVTPTLSIISNDWYKSPEFPQLKELLENCDDMNSFIASNSVHQSFSDTICWLPRVAARKFYQRGQNEGRYETIRSVADAFVQHMKQSSQKHKYSFVSADDDNYNLIPFPIESSQETNVEAIVTPSQ